MEDNKMKKASKWIILLGVAALVIIVVSFLNASKPLEFENEAKDIHTQLLENNHMISMQEVYKTYKTNKDEQLIIDLRSPKLFNQFHIEGAINIPADLLLSTDSDNIFSSEKKKIIVCGTALKANEAWMLLSQYGYKNMLVMEGGMDLYKELLSEFDKADYSRYHEEVAEFDFAAELKKISGGKTITSAKVNKPVLKVVKKKRKAAEGGCG